MTGTQSRIPVFTHQIPESIPMDSETLIDLQTRIAFQEQSLEEMNTVLTRQQKQIEVLVRELRALRDQYESLSAHGQAGQIEEKPPHY